MNAWVRLAISVSTAVAVAAACTSSTGQTGSETHWYSTCESDSACSAGLRCICGVCTRSCSERAPCDSETPSVCVAPSCDAAPAGKVCAPACSGAKDCTAGLSCVAGVCTRDTGKVDASSPAPSSSAPTDGGSATHDGSVTKTIDGSAASGSKPDASEETPTHHAVDGAVVRPRDGATSDADPLAVDCPLEVMPVGATQILSGRTAVYLGTASGVYIGVPHSGANVLRKLVADGGMGAPIGDQRLGAVSAGPSGLIFLSPDNSAFVWFSPEDDRVVATWARDPEPIHIGDHLFGYGPTYPDGGGLYGILELEPDPDGSTPVTRRVITTVVPSGILAPNAMVADETTFYIDVDNTIYEVVNNQPATPFAHVDGALYSFALSTSQLIVARGVISGSSTPGGLVAVDRMTGAQRVLAVEQGVFLVRVFGDGVYYAAPYPAGGSSCLALRRVPIAGGSPETLVISSSATFDFSQGALYVGTARGLFKMRP